MNENVQNDSYVEIDLLEVLSIIKANLVWIILAAILFGFGGFAITNYVMTPQYESSVNMIVNTRTDNNSTVSTIR